MMVNIKINGVCVCADEGQTILETAKSNGIHIPTLCHLKTISEDGMCRICVVEIKGSSRLYPACNTKVREGMDIETDSETVLASRRTTLDLICKRHRMDCDYCSRYTDCHLHELVRELGIDDRKYTSVYHPEEKDQSSSCIIRDNSKCVLCRRCEAMCSLQGIYAIGAINRADKTRIGSILPMPETGCVSCGQCLRVCPTGALSVKDSAQEVWNALRVSKKHVIAVVSPYSCSSLAESLHCESEPQGRTAAMLLRLGFKKVYSSENLVKTFEQSEADIAESRNVISAACPAAVKFLKNKYPEYSGYLSGKTSIFEHMAASASRAYAATSGVKVENIITVLVTPCIAAKGLNADDTLSVTTRELKKIIAMGCVSKFTSINIWKNITPEGMEMLPDAGTDTVLQPIRVDGLDNVDKLLSLFRAGAEMPKYISISACHEGCKNGGGQIYKKQ